MKYSHISFIQLIEILYSTRLRLVKYKFQFVEFRKYDYIPFVDQLTNRIVWDILVTANHFLILSKGSGGLHLLTCCSSICQPALTRHECGGGGRDDRWGCLEQPRVGPLPMSSPRLLDSTPRLAACRKYACAVNSLSKEKHVLFIFCSINKTDKQAFASSAPKLKKAVHQNKNLGEYTK